MLSIDGLVSGIDTASIIEGLVSIRQAQIDRLNVQKDSIVQKQTAFKGIEAQLLTLRGKLSAIGRSQNNLLEAKLASSSNEDLLTASASNSAINGVYSITVNSTATAHQIASQAFVEPESQITEGTLSIQLGNNEVVDITIDSSNNTVQGLVDAVNLSSEDVFASLITDSSGTRILFTGRQTGAANTIQITNSLGPDSGGAVRPDFSGAAVQVAGDASISFGSGAGAINVTSETNQFDDLIEGVAFNVLSADPTKPVTITVQNDIETATESIQGFVDAFNSLMSYIDSQSEYNVDNEIAGPLLGNRSTISIQNEVRNRLVFSIAGLDSEINQLSAIGLQFNDGGQLFVDTNRLNQVINGEIEGINSNDVKRLFALDGLSDNGGVEFLLGSSRTKASTTPYEVDITQAAERAEITGTTALPASIVIDGTNDQLSLAVDGAATGTLSLTQGIYTRQEIADHVESLINDSTGLKGQSVSVSLVNDQLTIRSNTYGSQSEINSLSGNALATLGLDSLPSDQGQDVAGQFIVDGVTESAVGSGRLLTGSADNENTADIQLRVTLTTNQVVAGTDAQITVTRGFASQLDQIISGFLDPTTGKIKTTDDSFQDQIDSIDLSIKSTEELMQIKTDALIAEFAAMEAALSTLQTQSSFLASQFSATPTTLNTN